MYVSTIMYVNMIYLLSDGRCQCVHPHSATGEDAQDVCRIALYGRTLIYITIPTCHTYHPHVVSFTLYQQASSCSIAFVSKSCLSSGVGQGYALQKKLVAVKNVRTIGKKDMRLNDATPTVTVDPET